jgi:hypothetical protein
MLLTTKNMLLLDLKSEKKQHWKVVFQTTSNYVKECYIVTFKKSKSRRLYIRLLKVSFTFQKTRNIHLWDEIWRKYTTLKLHPLNVYKQCIVAVKQLKTRRLQERLVDVKLASQKPELCIFLPWFRWKQDVEMPSFGHHEKTSKGVTLSP